MENCSMDTKQTILNKTEALFMRYGLKSVTMDDISRELGISKKTLYQYVANKQDLIEQIFQKRIQEEKSVMRQIRSETRDAIEEMLKIAAYVTLMLRKMSPTVMYDLEKYYKKTWSQMQQLHKRHVYQIILDNLERGIADGVYRAEINPDIIAKIYVAKSTDIVDPEIFPAMEYHVEELFREFILYHLYGIISSRGRELMDRHLDEYLKLTK